MNHQVKIRQHEWHNPSEGTGLFVSEGYCDISFGNEKPTDDYEAL